MSTSPNAREPEEASVANQAESPTDADLVPLYVALVRINQAIARSNSRADLFPKACQCLVEQGGLRTAWIGWLNAETQRMDSVACCGDDPTSLPPSKIEERVPPAFAAFPLRMNGAVCGAVHVYADRAGVFCDEEIALLEEAAGDVSFALEHFAREETRRQTEFAVRRDETLSDTTIENMPGILCFYDLEGRFLRWNKNLETVSGYSETEIADMHLPDFFQEADQAEVAARVAEVWASGVSSIEADFVARDGSVIPYYFSWKRVTFQQQTYLVGVGIDISERKHSEARLRESETHLIEAQRIAKLGSWELNIGKNKLKWSDQIYEIFGINRAEFAGTYEAFLEFVKPEDHARLRSAQQAALAGESRLDLEHTIVLRDGTEKVVRELSDLQQDEAGRPLVLKGTVHDITDRVRIEVERAKRYRAEAADRVKSAFLATMSHELRTPLNSIIGFTGILLQELAGPLNEEQSKQLDMVRTSACHLLALVNDVLDISKIEAGQLEVARETFDLPGAVRKAAASVRKQAEAKGLALRVDISAALGNAIGDERRFAQILLNLLSNAVKFTEHGEIALVAEAAVHQTRPAVRLRVSDTGEGIIPDDLRTLFQPFRQLDSGLSRKHDGTGLGLAICRRLAGLMGGVIDAESERGKGSVFTLLLPLEQLPLEEPVAP